MSLQDRYRIIQTNWLFQKSIFQDDSMMLKPLKSKYGVLQPNEVLVWRICPSGRSLGHRQSSYLICCQNGSWGCGKLGRKPHHCCARNAKLVRMNLNSSIIFYQLGNDTRFQNARRRNPVLGITMTSRQFPDRITMVVSHH